MAVELIADELGVTFSVDAVLSERHDRTSRVTQFPIEDGGTISDHIRNEPQRVSVEGFVTDSPLFPFPGASAVAAIMGQAERPSIEAFRLLDELRDQRAPVTLITGLKRYADMVLVGLSVPRDQATGRSLRFSADFEQITIVDTQIVDIPADQLEPGKATEQGASELDMGKQQPEPVSGSIGKLIQESLTDLFEQIGLGAVEGVSP